MWLPLSGRSRSLPPASQPMLCRICLYWIKAQPAGGAGAPSSAAIHPRLGIRRAAGYRAHCRQGHARPDRQPTRPGCITTITTAATPASRASHPSTAYPTSPVRTARPQHPRHRIPSSTHSATPQRGLRDRGRGLSCTYVASNNPCHGADHDHRCAPALRGRVLGMGVGSDLRPNDRVRCGWDGRSHQELRARRACPVRQQDTSGDTSSSGCRYE